MTDREQMIRERAHAIWEEEGRPEGRDQDHWERAARDIDAHGHSGALPTSGIGHASGLQPGGTNPGNGPGASFGSLGTGGGSTGGAATGSVDRSNG